MSYVYKSTAYTEVMVAACCYPYGTTHYICDETPVIWF